MDKDAIKHIEKFFAGECGSLEGRLQEIEMSCHQVYNNRDKIADIDRRLCRLEEGFARLQHISLYKLKEYFESYDIAETIETLQGIGEAIYEEQSGKDYATGEDIKNGTSK